MGYANHRKTKIAGTDPRQENYKRHHKISLNLVNSIKKCRPFGNILWKNSEYSVPSRL